MTYGICVGACSMVMRAKASRARYGVRVVTTGYTGALMTLRRPSDGDQQDVIYSAGAYRLASDGVTTVTTWLGVGGEPATVSRWYDQSGNQQHAVQTTVASQPLLNLSNGSLNLRTSRTLNMPFAVPRGAFSFVVRHGAINDNSYGGLLGSGPYTYNNAVALRMYNTKYWFYTFGTSDFEASVLNSQAINVVGATYDGTAVRIYSNGALTTTKTGAFTATVKSENTIIGRTWPGQNEYYNGDLYGVLVIGRPRPRGHGRARPRADRR